MMSCLSSKGGAFEQRVISNKGCGGDLHGKCQSKGFDGVENIRMIERFKDRESIEYN